MTAAKVTTLLMQVRQQMLSTSLTKMMMKLQLNLTKTHLIGGTGKDTIEANGGDGSDDKAVSIDGGSGDDTLAITGSNDAANTIDGGSGEDTITDLDGDSTLNGDGDDDNITTGAGNDTVTGGAGDDTIKINGTGNKLALGSDGDDVFEFSSAIDKNDTIKGEGGTADTLKYYQDTSGS